MLYSKQHSHGSIGKQFSVRTEGGSSEALYIKTHVEPKFSNPEFPLMKPFLYFRAAVTALLLLVTIHQEFMLLHRDTGNYKVHLLSRVRKQGICEFIKKINYFNYFMTLSVH